MKIKLKSEVIEEKTFNYILHTLHITEANILDYLKLNKLFHTTDWSTSKWEEFTDEKKIISCASTRNIKENSFNIEIDDYDNNALEILKQFLSDNNLQFTN